MLSRPVLRRLYGYGHRTQGYYTTGGLCIQEEMPDMRPAPSYMID